MKELLFREGHRFNFFHAVRSLAFVDRGRKPVGGFNPPALESVRFRSHASLAFPPSDVVAVRPGRREGAPPELTLAFAGLVGPAGVLPEFYTELVIERDRRDDRTLHDFLDLFTHRLVSFFYRAWQKYRLPMAYDAAGKDALTGALFALVGLGTPHLRGRLAAPDAALLLYAGLVAQKPCSASALEAVVGAHFGLPARVLPFRRHWFAIDPHERSRLGRRCSELGVDARLGERVLVAQSQFRLRLGPLRLQGFLDFLPGGARSRELMQLVGFLVGAELDFEVQLVLDAAEVPPCELSDDPAAPPLLGLSTWLKSRPFSRDADHCVVDADPFGLDAPRPRAEAA